MSRGLLALAALALSLLGAGCPFVSYVPIAQPGAPLDARLTGLWANMDPADPDSLRLLIVPFNANEYYAELREDQDEVTRYRVYPFALAGEPYLHVSLLAPDAERASYFFVRWSLSEDGELSLDVIAEDAVPDSLQADAAALTAYLTARRGEPTLSDEDTSLRLRRIAR